MTHGHPVEQGDPSNAEDRSVLEEVLTGPSSDPWWKYVLACCILYLLLFSLASPLLTRIPGAISAGIWAFETAFDSQPDWEENS